MPFKSKAQARLMFDKHPAIAKRWAKITPDMKALPEHAPAPGGRVHQIIEGHGAIRAHLALQKNQFRKGGA